MTPVLAVRSDTPSLGDALAQFRDAIKNAGLEPPEVIEPDSKLHRFSANGKRGDDAGWYVLHADGIPAGAFGDWRSGLSETWRADIGRKLTPAEEAAHRTRLDAIRREREVEDAKRKAEAQAQAAAIWQAARPATEHPYLIAKGVASYGLRLEVGRLVIPLRDSEGVLHSLQFIAHDGEKRFLPGGHVKGGYFAIGKPNGTLCIAEGYATAASIHEATGHAVAVAFNAGNLLPVARALRAKYPELRIIVCADNDQWTEGNPGLTKAREAAETVGGLLAMPSFRDIAAKPTDFNDLAKLEGPEAVRRCIEATERASGTTNERLPGTAVMRCLADVNPEPINWLWPVRIARGKVSMVAGDPGLGKSLVTLDIAARVTQGKRWPVDNIPCPIGDVVLLSAEDDAADTIRPRLDAVGADVRRVHLLQAVSAASYDGDLTTRSFSLRRDLNVLDKVLAERPDCALVIVDPVSAYLDGTDSHNNADVRALLAPLGELAARHKVAVVCVAHLNKGGQQSAMYRVTGSLAFVAAARSVLAVTKDKGDPARRLVLPVKNNLGADSLGLAYRIKSVNGLPVVDWEPDPVTVSVDEALGSADTNEERSATDEAVDWLRDLLRVGPMKASDVQKEARQAGIGDKPLRRARERLGIKPKKREFAGGWEWALPSIEVAQDAQDAYPTKQGIFGGGGHLPESWETDI